MRRIAAICAIAGGNYGPVNIGIVYCPADQGGAAINLSGPASTWGQYHAKGQQDYFNYVNEKKAEWPAAKWK